MEGVVDPLLDPSAFLFPVLRRRLGARGEQGGCFEWVDVDWEVSFALSFHPHPDFGQFCFIFLESDGPLIGRILKYRFLKFLRLPVNESFVRMCAVRQSLGGGPVLMSRTPLAPSLG